MTDEAIYRITRRSGVDTVHRNPGEQCNLDDTEADRPIDEDRALELIERHDARGCAHCWKDIDA